jgi:hypothetical protein
VAVGASPFAKALAAGVAVIMVLVSVLATRDYLAWNVARWTLLDAAEAGLGITAREIDGGYEYNGVRNYDPDYPFSGERSWWWVLDDRYLVAFGPVPGYRERDRRTFRRWLPPRQGAILLLERESQHAASKTPGT